MSETKVIRGDCLEQLRLLPSDSVDCVITSPPYNLKGIRGGTDLSKLENRKKMWKQVTVNYDVCDDNLPEDEYQQWQVNILNECHRVIKPTGSVFYNHKIRKWKMESHHPFTFIQRSQLKFYQEIVWDRQITMAMSPRQLFPMTERIFWLVKDKPKVYKKAVEPQYRKDIWSIYPCKRNQHQSMDWRRVDHPAPFPALIPEICIALTTLPGDTVLDPFAGCGTTLVAAQQLGRNSIGIEISEKYCQLIEQRLNEKSKTSTGQGEQE